VEAANARSLQLDPFTPGTSHLLLLQGAHVTTQLVWLSC
jgi:hypothetical protein